MPPRPIAALALAAALLLPPSARAALAVRVSVEDLARGSDAVVRGRVEARRAIQGSGRIWTEVRIRAAERWRGDAPDVVTVLVPGGTAGRIAMRVDGAPSFSDAEEVVVFVARSPDGRFRVSGLAQGKFRVEGASAKPGLDGTRFVKELVRPGERGAEEMSVAELKRRVQGAR